MRSPSWVLEAVLWGGAELGVMGGLSLTLISLMGALQADESLCFRDVHDF